MTANDDLYFRQLPLGPMQNFVYLIGSRRLGQCLVVDPAWDTKALLETAGADDMTITGALVTHYHPDHVGGSMMGFQVPGGIAELIGKTDAKIHVNKHEADGLIKVTGVSESDLVRHAGGDAIEIGDVKIELLHTPGHTPGSQCFLVHSRLVAGDTLFVNGCGRVDLPGSDPVAMYHTLTGTLGKLDDDVVLYPGHDYGPSKTSNFAEQRLTNAYLRPRSLEEWQRLMGR
jgi:hydroxyacylglutathione hydrolase